MHDSISAVEVLPITAADAAYAASIFGPISEARDAEELPDFAVEDLDSEPDWDELANQSAARESVERGFPAPDAFFPERAWVNELTKALLGRGYFGIRLGAIMDIVVDQGSAECVPAALLTYESDRAMIESHIPPASPSAWAAHEGFVWNAVECVPTAVMRSR